ncbi:MAG TPA: DUF6363 domain-containing protein, partial [Candidatus Babeliales bacterium]|nr:DUF6363 domain-containing protein [Candidatus Babeliales bacterium]
IGILKQLMRNMDIMSSEILRNDLETRCNEAENHVKIRVFMPDKELTSNSLNFDPEKLRHMYEEGRRIAARMITKY